MAKSKKVEKNKKAKVSSTTKSGKSKKKKVSKVKTASAQKPKNAGSTKRETTNNAVKSAEKAKKIKTRATTALKGAEIDITIKNKVLGKAPEEYHFHLKGGKDLGTLKELAEELDKMEEHVFDHHVSDMNNDFSNWIHDIFDDKELAEELKALNDRIEMRHKILERLMKLA